MVYTVCYLLQVEDAAYYGEGCECDNFSCPKGPNGLVCSGKCTIGNKRRGEWVGKGRRGPVYVT